MSGAAAATASCGDSVRAAAAPARLPTAPFTSSCLAPPRRVTAGAAARQQAPGGGGGGASAPSIEPGSGGYALLAGLHAGAALTAFIAPAAIAGFYFPGGILPEGFQSQVGRPCAVCLPGRPARAH